MVNGNSIRATSRQRAFVMGQQAASSRKNAIYLTKQKATNVVRLDNGQRPTGNGSGN